MKIKQKILLALIALSPIALAQDGPTEGSEGSEETKSYTNRVDINYTYFTQHTVSGNKYNKLVVVTDKDFHTCGTGSKRWGEIREVDLGARFFDHVSSGFVAALLANKKVSINISNTECYGGTRAKILSMRLDQ